MSQKKNVLHNKYFKAITWGSHESNWRIHLQELLRQEQQRVKEKNECLKMGHEEIANSKVERKIGTVLWSFFFCEMCWHFWIHFDIFHHPFFLGKQRLKFETMPWPKPKPAKKHALWRKPSAKKPSSTWSNCARTRWSTTNCCAAMASMGWRAVCPICYGSCRKKCWPVSGGGAGGKAIAGT